MECRDNSFLIQDNSFLLDLARFLCLRLFNIDTNIQIEIHFINIKYDCPGKI